ncbi:uncharacterized protein LOC133193479 [Saccostrea echinata]|uniref:uncharacterized protein LOC133193479 n=1 Tax=Saccostrea echinata TaxID=191078 RepID=UPI002A7ED434|nr:uncharacterized protein LOC133193479 [Saccostrea echinata]
MHYNALMLMLLTALCSIPDSLQHGYMIDPPSRSSLWRVNDKAPPNYNDNRLYCGGRQKIQELGGLCGPCGDPYDGERENEAGGKYALGIISKKLPDGADILETKVVITAFHKGYFEFRICVNNDVTKRVTQECLNENLMTIVEGDDQFPTRFYPPGPGDHVVHVNLPNGIKCSQCVVQWRYRTGNSWGRDLDGTGCLGCGVQEEFRTCSDISIGAGDGKEQYSQNNQELVDPLVTENNMQPRVKTLRSFIPKFQNKVQIPPVPPTPALTVRTTQKPEVRRLTLDHLLKPKINIDNSRHRGRPIKPKPRITFLESTTTERPVIEPTTSTNLMKTRLMQLRKLKRLAALAIQMKSLLNTLRHLPVFKNLNLGKLDEEIVQQRDAPWNNLVKPSDKKTITKVRSFPWQSGLSLNEIKSKTNRKPVQRSRSSAHILSIPPAKGSPKFNFPVLPPPSRFLGGQFRREKTRTVTLGSEKDDAQVTESLPITKEKNTKENNFTIYKNEFNVISPESLEGETSIADWYKKIVKLMVQKQYPVSEIKKKVERLQQIKDVHKTKPTVMLESLQNSDVSVTKTEFPQNALSDNSLSSALPTLQPTSSTDINMVYPKMDNTPAVENRNAVYPEADQRPLIASSSQKARDINAIPPNINTVRRHVESGGPSVSNPYVDYSEDNQLTPAERRPLTSKLRNFLEFNPEFRIPFGAVFH